MYLHDAPAAHIEALSLASKAIKAGLVVENLSDFTTDSEIELEPEVFVVSAVYPLATFFNLQLAYAFVKHTFPQHTQQVNDQNMKVFHGPNAMHVSIHRFPEIREEEENEVACEKPNPF